MKKVNALRLRTKFGEVMKELKEEGRPILLSRGGAVEAALVPIDLFNERFVDVLGSDALRELLCELDRVRAKPKSSRPSQEDLRALRGSLT